MSDLIPKNIYLRIKEWIDQRKDGQIALNLSDGAIRNAEFKEKVIAQ